MFYGEFSHYSRVLVDIDLDGSLNDSIILTRKEWIVIVYLDYEYLPDFCTSYGSVRHIIVNCRCMEHRSSICQEKVQVLEKSKSLLLKL